MIRYRILYSKTEALRYTGNLDMHKIWERLLRRAHLPLGYSQGFHPQPRLNQASPLPLGITSRFEMIDIWLDEDLPAEPVFNALNDTPQPGIEVQRVEVVELSAPTLQRLIIAAEYRVVLLDPISPDVLNDRIEKLLSTSTLVRQRRDKTYDLRPFIESLEVAGDSTPQTPVILMRLTARQQGQTGRADEVLSALEIEPYNARLERSALILESAA